MGNENNRNKSSDSKQRNADTLCTRVPITNAVDPLTHPLSTPDAPRLSQPSTSATPSASGRDTGCTELEALRAALSDSYCTTDDGFIFASEAERADYLIKARLFETEQNYYSKYQHEVVFSFDHMRINKSDAIREMSKAVIRLYRKLYGRHNVRAIKFDYYAVLERKAKNKQKTHPHWHVLLHLPITQKRLELTQELAVKCWIRRNSATGKHELIGDVWSRDQAVKDGTGKPLTDVHTYIFDYLSKNKDSHHHN